MAYFIGELCKQVGMTPDTVRYYEKIRLIPKPSRDHGGRRLYSEKEISQLRFAQQAQKIGFTLAEIGQLLRFRDDPTHASNRVRRLAQLKFEETTARLAELQRLHDELAVLLQLCSGDAAACPILESLEPSGARSKLGS